MIKLTKYLLRSAPSSIKSPTMAQQPLVGQGLLIIKASLSLRRTTLEDSSEEWTARYRDLYLTTHNTHKKQTSMPPAGFKPAIPASEWPQTHALDHAATTLALYQSTAVNYEDESNENLKSVIKIWNTARLSCKLATVILMAWRVADRWQYDGGT
jgi:hypothetical protein